MLGEGLRLIRVFSDCKPSVLASKLGISASYLSEIESGKKTPSMDVLKKYAECFGTTVSAIMFFAEDIQAEKKKPFKKAIRSKLIKFLQVIEHVTS